MVGNVFMAAMWNRCLSPNDVFAISENPWQLFAAPRRRRVYSLPGGGNVSAALTGQGVTADIGSVGPALTVALTGLGFVFAQGSLTVPGSTNVALTGQRATLAPGNLMAGIAVNGSGQPVHFSTGTVDPSSAIAILGSSAGMGLGALAPSLSVPVLGRGFTFSHGTLAPTLSLGLAGNLLRSTAGELSAPVGLLGGDPRYVIRRMVVREFTASRQSRRTFSIHRKLIRSFEVSSVADRFPVKGPSETVPLTFDFSGDLPSGVTLSGTPALSVTVTEGTDANPSAILSGAAGFDASVTGVVQAVTGGLDGCEYTITCTCSTTQANLTLSLVGILPVRADLN